MVHALIGSIPIQLSSLPQNIGNLLYVTMAFQYT